MMLVRSKLVTGVGLVLLALVGSGQAQCGPGAESADGAGVELFTLQYGDGPAQLGLPAAMPGEPPARGPGSIQVDRAGNVWLLDVANLQVKAFRRDGTLLRVVGRAPHDPGEDRGEDDDGQFRYLDTVRQFAFDGRGYVYLVGDSPQVHLFVVNPAGQIVTSARDQYGVLVEMRGEDKVLWQLREGAGLKLGMIESLDLWGMFTTNADGLYLLGRAATQNPDRKGEETSIYRLDAALEYVGTVPGYYVGPDGYTYEFADGNTDDNMRLHVYDPRGQRVSTVRLVHPEGRWAGCHTPTFDSSQNIYLPCSTRRGEARAVIPGVEISHDMIIYKFDSGGSLLGRFRIPASPMASGVSPRIAVDEEERMYYLDFRSTGVAVVMVPTKSSADGRPD